MRTVRGRVAEKKPVSLKKAARIVSSFAARDSLASQDITNYIKRAAVEFNELVHFHQQLRQGRNAGALWSDNASAGDREASAGRKPEARESFGGKEPREEKKRDVFGGFPPLMGGAKVGISSEEQQVDCANELLAAKNCEKKGCESIVADEAVEVRKSAVKGRKSNMNVAVEGFVKVAAKDNGKRVDGRVDPRSEEMRKKRKSSDDDDQQRGKNRAR